GFRVIRTDQGDDFALGILEPPKRPAHPFALGDSDRISLASETTDIGPNQVDFLGPFEVTENGQALFLRFKVNGPPLDALVMTRMQGEPFREALQRGTPLAPPASPPITTFVIQPNSDQTQHLRLPPGQYYALVDNSNRTGTS